MTNGDDLRRETSTGDGQPAETSTAVEANVEVAGEAVSAKEKVEEPEQDYREALGPIADEIEKQLGAEHPEPTPEGPETEPEQVLPAQKLQEPSDPPETPPTFEQHLMSVARRAPELDGAAEAMATDLVREKGFHHVKAWRLPDGSILITKG